MYNGIEEVEFELQAQEAEIEEMTLSQLVNFSDEIEVLFEETKEIIRTLEAMLEK